MKEQNFTKLSRKEENEENFYSTLPSPFLLPETILSSSAIPPSPKMMMWQIMMMPTQQAVQLNPFTVTLPSESKLI